MDILSRSKRTINIPQKRDTFHTEVTTNNGEKDINLLLLADFNVHLVRHVINSTLGTGGNYSVYKFLVYNQVELYRVYDLQRQSQRRRPSKQKNCSRKTKRTQQRQRRHKASSIKYRSQSTAAFLNTKFYIAF